MQKTAKVTIRWSSGIKRVIGLVCLVAAVHSVAIEQLFTVTEKEASLYLQRQIARVLLADQIVTGEVREDDRDWMQVQYEGKVFDAKRAQFKSLTDFKKELGAEAAEAAHGRDRLTRQINEAGARLTELLAARAAVQFDDVIEFRIKTAEIAVPITETARDGSVVTPPRVMIRPVYKYVEKISRSRANQLIKGWDKEIADLEKRQTELTKRRRQLASDEIAAGEKLAERIRMFAAYEADPRNYLQDLYKVTRDRAVLFRLRDPVTELRLHAVVPGRPDLKFREWLHILHEDEWLQSRKVHFTSQTSMLNEFKQRLNTLEQALVDLQANSAMVQDEIRLIQTLGLALEYETELRRFPLGRSPFPRDFAGFRLYRPASPPSDAVEVVDRASASRLQKEWGRRSGDLQGKLDTIDKEIGAVRRSLTELTPDYEEAELLFRNKMRQLGLPAATRE